MILLSVIRGARKCYQRAVCLLMLVNKRRELRYKEISRRTDGLTDWLTDGLFIWLKQSQVRGRPRSFATSLDKCSRRLHFHTPAWSPFPCLCFIILAAWKAWAVSSSPGVGERTFHSQHDCLFSTVSKSDGEVVRTFSDSDLPRGLRRDTGWNSKTLPARDLRQVYW
jgi:hypothetical protein